MRSRRPTISKYLDSGVNKLVGAIIDVSSIGGHGCRRVLVIQSSSTHEYGFITCVAPVSRSFFTFYSDELKAYKRYVFVIDPPPEGDTLAAFEACVMASDYDQALKVRKYR